MQPTSYQRTTTPIGDIAVAVFFGLWLFAVSAVIVGGLIAVIARSAFTSS